MTTLAQLDPLISSAGSPIVTPDQWYERRAELLALFSEHV